MPSTPDIAATICTTIATHCGVCVNTISTTPTSTHTTPDIIKPNPFFFRSVICFLLRRIPRLSHNLFYRLSPCFPLFDERLVIRDDPNIIINHSWRGNHLPLWFRRKYDITCRPRNRFAPGYYSEREYQREHHQDFSHCSPPSISVPAR